MTSVLAFADLLAGEDAAPEAQRRWIEHIQTQSSRMADIINDMLNASQVEAGKMELAVVDVDARALCATLLEEFGVKAPADHFLLRVPEDARCADFRLGAYKVIFHLAQAGHGGDALAEAAGDDDCFGGEFIRPVPVGDDGGDAVTGDGELAQGVAQPVMRSGVLGALGEAGDVADTVKHIGLRVTPGYVEGLAGGGVDFSVAGSVEYVLRRCGIAAQALRADDAAAELIANVMAPVDDGDAVAALGQMQRGMVACRSCADDEDVRCWRCHPLIVVRRIGCAGRSRRTPHYT